MANNLLTPIMITREAARVLENNLVYAKFINREYSDSFAITGAKIGNTINVRIPPQYTGRTGATLAVEDAIETFRPLVLTTQFGVDIAFTTADMTLSIDDFSERFLTPAMAKIANTVDLDGLTVAKNTTFNLVGTPGTVPNTLLTYLQAGVKLKDQAVPMDGNISAILSPIAEATLVDAQKGLFQQADLIAEQYRTGTMGRAGGFKFSMDQNVPLHTVGPLGGSPTTTGAQSASAAPSGVTGAAAANLLTPFPLVTGGWTAAAAVRLQAGDVFTLATVFAVNPQSKQSTGQLQQFVVTSQFSSDGAGAGSVNILPRPIFTGPFQNVTSATNNIPNATPLVVVGTAATGYRQNFVLHKDAQMMGTADLIMPDGVDWKARVNYKGMSIRAIRQYRIGTDDLPTRTDILYGFAPLYPQLGSRVTE
jgi:hypothetical protein